MKWMGQCRLREWNTLKEFEKIQLHLQELNLLYQIKRLRSG